MVKASYGILLVLIGIFAVNCELPPRNCTEAFRIGALKHHNNLRLFHDTRELKSSSDLDSSAANVAERLANAQFVNRFSAITYGENLGFASSYKKHPIDPQNCYALGVRVTQRWYDEINSYDFDRPGLSDLTSHFTQLVWQNSTQVGFGLAFGDEGRSYFAVAHYSPVGNVKGSFAENVLPPNSDEAINRRRR